jgi:twitching motility protein PilI
MAERISLRDYQRDLAERLRAADTARSSSKLAVQAGGEGWLVDLQEAGEVIPVPPITAVAQTRPWFKGVANVRGNLYSVVDFPAFLGGVGVSLGEQSRLLLVAPRYRVGAALLVDASLGLRNPESWQPRETAQAPAAWQRAEYEDETGKVWKELDMAELVRDQNFLTVAS